MLQFNEAAGYATNIDLFLQHAENIDATKGAILRELFSQLTNSDDDSIRTRMRSMFNAAVLQKLEPSDTDLVED